MNANERKRKQAIDAIHPINLLICEKYSQLLLYSCITISIRHNTYYTNHAIVDYQLLTAYSRLALPNHTTKLVQSSYPPYRKNLG